MQPVKLAIATPVRASDYLAAQVTFGYSESVRMLVQETGAELISPVMSYALDAMRARNRIAAYVLRELPMVTHVLWWDDDQWPEDRRIVKEMLDTGVDVVAAPYPAKEYPIRLCHVPLSPMPEPEVNGLQEFKWLGFGFTITSVRALQWMAEECSRRMTHEWRVYTEGAKRHRVASLFNGIYRPTNEGLWMSPEDDSLISEDYSFCERWRDLGGKVYVYRNAGIVSHAGPHSFRAVG